MSPVTVSNAHREGTKIAAAKIALDAILAKEGNLTPALVVDAAKRKDSPLHHYFTWDNSKAAQNYRLLEAAILIRTVRMKISTGDVTHRASAFLLPVRGEGNYRPITEVISNKELADAMLDIARSELTAFKNKFGKLERLAALWPPIDEVLGE